MRVAITGASGYVGGLLARAHAARGDTVHALGRNVHAIPAAAGVLPFRGDIRDVSSIADAFFDADVFYHCAAEISDESLMHAVNVAGTRALLARARGRVGRWVQLGSLSVYGTPRAGVIDENSPPRPRTPYARTKLQADEVVMAGATDGCTYTILRPAAVVGPRVRGTSMHALVRAVVSGRFRYIGPRGAISNCVHENDVVDALVLCGTRAEASGRIYNVSQNVTYEQMIAAIAEATGAPAPSGRLPEWFARAVAGMGRIIPGFPLTPSRIDALTSRVEYRSDRIERELGFRHRNSIEQALRDIARESLRP